MYADFNTVYQFYFYCLPVQFREQKQLFICRCTPGLHAHMCWDPYKETIAPRGTSVSPSRCPKQAEACTDMLCTQNVLCTQHDLRSVLCSAHPLPAGQAWRADCNEVACRQLPLGHTNSLPSSKAAATNSHVCILFSLTVKMINGIILFQKTLQELKRLKYCVTFKWIGSAQDTEPARRLIQWCITWASQHLNGCKTICANLFSFFYNKCYFPSFLFSSFFLFFYNKCYFKPYFTESECPCSGITTNQQLLAQNPICGNVCAAHSLLCFDVSLLWFCFNMTPFHQPHVFCLLILFCCKFIQCTSERIIWSLYLEMLSWVHRHNILCKTHIHHPTEESLHGNAQTLHYLSELINKRRCLFKFKLLNWFITGTWLFW